MVVTAILRFTSVWYWGLELTNMLSVTVFPLFLKSEWSSFCIFSAQQLLIDDVNLLSRPVGASICRIFGFIWRSAVDVCVNCRELCFDALIYLLMLLALISTTPCLLVWYLARRLQFFCLYMLFSSPVLISFKSTRVPILDGCAMSTEFLAIFFVCANVFIRCRLSVQQFSAPDA